MNESRNPYAPPVADVADVPGADSNPGGTFIPNGRSVPIGNGVQWMTKAFQLFFQAPGKWIVVCLILIVISFVSSFVPLGSLAMTVFWPVIGGGVLYAIHQQRTQGSFEIGAIFSGFGPRLGQLAIVGVILLLTFPLAMVVFAVFLGADIARMITMGGDGMDPLLFEGMFLRAILASLVYLLLAIPIIAATYLAPALVMLHGIRAVDAAKMSFIGLIKNILPGLLFGIVMSFVVLISMLPLMLGLLVTLPVAMIATYTMYRDIFVEEEQ
jgi:uncharacterized membrane protein